MKTAVIVLGLGNGDEGKGQSVDALTRKLDSKLTVRFNGGSQCGHRVQLPDGRSHIFAQFGSGTLAGARTYIGPNVIVWPEALVREAAHLKELGVEDPFAKVVIDPDALVTTYWHRLLNRARELKRGTGRHGSCGHGIGETRSYWLKYGMDAIRYSDLALSGNLRNKLELLRQRTLATISDEQLDMPDGMDKPFTVSTAQLLCDLREAAIPWYGYGYYEDSETVIFEGAQGILLDEWRGFHPYTTWSDTTDYFARELISAKFETVERVRTLGVTRSYATRHGPGPFPSHDIDLTDQLGDDLCNPFNEWQRKFFCGWLDLPLLKYAIKANGGIDGLVVNHLDQYPGRFVKSYHWPFRHGDEVTNSVPTRPDLAMQRRFAEFMMMSNNLHPALEYGSADQLLETLGELAPIAITSHGPTYEDREFRGLGQLLENTHA